MQVEGSEEVQAKIGALGGALGQFDQKAAVTAQTTGQTLPAGFDRTAKSAEQASKSVTASTGSFQVAALGLTSAASGAFALYNQYDRLEKIQVRIATAEKNLTQGRATLISAQQTLDDLVRKGITSGSQYEAAVLRVQGAQEQLSITEDRLNIAQDDLTQQQIQFGLSVLPTVFSAVQGVSSAMTILKTVQTATSASSLILTPVLGGQTAAMVATTGATTGAATATGGLSIAMRILQLAMGPVGLIILGIGAAMTAFATNAFGMRDAINAAGKAIGDAVPIMRPLLDALATLANTIFPQTSHEAEAMSESVTASLGVMDESATVSAEKFADKLDRIQEALRETLHATDSASSELGKKQIGSGGTDETSPLLDRIVAGLSGKRDQVTQEKVKIVQQLVELTSGVKVALQDIPTDAPKLQELIDGIRDQLRSTLKVDFDFDASDIKGEFDKVKDALTLQTNLPLDVKIRTDSLQKDLDALGQQIESTKRRISDLSGGRDLDELRKSLALGDLQGENDSFVNALIEKLDALGNKSETIKQKIYDMTHVEFKPAQVAEAESKAITPAEQKILDELKANVERSIQERAHAIEQIESLIFGREIKFTEKGAHDIPGIAKIADDLTAQLKDKFNIKIDFGAQNLEAEVDKVRAAFASGGTATQASVSDMQAGIKSGLGGVTESAATTSAEVGTEFDKLSAVIESNKTRIEQAVFSMQGTFLGAFNTVLDGAQVFTRGLDEYAQQIQAAFQKNIAVKFTLNTDGIASEQSKLQGVLQTLDDFIAQVQTALTKHIDVKFDLGTDAIKAEFESLQGTLATQGQAIQGAVNDMQTAVKVALAGLGSSTSTASATVGASFDKLAGVVASNQSKIETSVFSMRGVFLGSFSLILDAAQTFSKGLDKYADAVVSDVNRIEKALRSIGLNSGAGRDLVDLGALGSASRRAGSPAPQETRITINLDGQQLKDFVNKTTTSGLAGLT